MNGIRQLDDEHLQMVEDARRVSSALAMFVQGRRFSALQMLRRGRGEQNEIEIVDCYNKNIPIDLMLEILSILPIKSIGRFMLASKSWWGLITSCRFSIMHAKNNPLYTFFGKSSRGFNNCISVVEVSQNGDSVQTNFAGAKFNLDVTVVGSCNGLLCLVERRSRFCDIFIFNPITYEKIRVNSSKYDFEGCAVDYSFGYSPSTNEYKVLRCTTTVPDEGPIRDEYDILTVGVDQRWRKLPLQLFPCYIWAGNKPMVPSCKGTFHWIADDGGVGGKFILAFDIGEENTWRIPIPKTDQWVESFLVSNDPLCLCYLGDEANTIWKMGEDGDSWSQIEEPSILCDPRVKFITSVDCAANKCGGILFKVGRGCDDDLGLYCPKSKRYTRIPSPGEPGLVNQTSLLCELAPRFCSIRDIMGKPCG